MKKVLDAFLNKLRPLYGAIHKFILISLAAWIAHILLRLLLLFRDNPYGFPFVSKPDWFIFHAVCIDFMWICNSLVIFLAAGVIASCIARNAERTGNIFVKIYAVFQGILLPLTFFDNEVQRFLGSHLSFGLIDTYNDTSSIVMFWDYMENDLSIPFLQIPVLLLIVPLAFTVYKLLQKALRIPAATSSEFCLKKSVIAMLVFYIASYLFVYFIWTGGARMTKLRPVVALVYRELFVKQSKGGLDAETLAAYKASYQNLWRTIEGDSLWEFSDAKEGNGLPLYRVPSAELLASEKLKAQREMKPNFILVLMESQRGLNVGFMNPQNKPSPTPFMDSLAEYSHAWTRMHTSGVPTTGGVLSTHIGIPHHTRLSQATDLAPINLPSFASVLTENGYSTHYMSAADPAWDNLGMWMHKWYTAQHYNREFEDDSTFVDHAIEYVRDTLSKEGKPFLATLMTRSNHYPFNFAAGMTEEQKQLPLQQRINVTMNYADRQIARFFHAIENEEWYKNTYVIVMADHGFPLGENGVSTMNGGGFSNVSWIPFFIHGKGLDAVRDTTPAAQIDIAPTVLELAGFAVSNIFMGHNLLRNNGNGLSLGAYSGYAAIGLDGYRYIAKYPSQEETHIFADSDTRQENELTGKLQNEESRLSATLDTLLKISDYSLERGL